MKTVSALIATAALVAGSSRPNIEQIKHDATTKLQTEIDSQFGQGKAKVTQLDLVAAGNPHFEGSASVAIGAKSISLPIKVTSDGSTTIVSADESEVGKAIEENGTSIVAQLSGKYSDYILTPSLFSKMPATLKKDADKFKERLANTSPIEEGTDGFTGSGCKTGGCTSDEAAWFLSKDGTTSAAIIMETNTNFSPEAQLSFQIYGATIKTLPPSLASWAQDNGMTEFNSAEIHEDYTPPPKN